MNRGNIISVGLDWTPLSSPDRPEAYETILFWNPCDGIHVGFWDGYEFRLGEVTNDFDAPAVGRLSVTHWAMPAGPPDPSGDINVNWKLYRGEYGKQHDEP